CTSGPGEPKVDHARASEPPPAGVKAEIVPPIWLETDEFIVSEGSGPELEASAVVQSSRSCEAAPVASCAEFSWSFAPEIATGSATKLVRAASETDACSPRYAVWSSGATDTGLMSASSASMPVAEKPTAVLVSIASLTGS